MSKIGWPQVAMIVFIAIGLYNELMRHGEPQTGTHNFWTYAIGAAIEIALLKAGGFF